MHSAHMLLCSSLFLRVAARQRVSTPCLASGRGFFESSLIDAGGSNCLSVYSRRETWREGGVRTSTDESSTSRGLCKAHGCASADVNSRN